MADQTFLYGLKLVEVNLSTPWPEGRGLLFDKPFDKLKAVSVSNGSRPRVEPGGSRFTLSRAFYPVFNGGASRGRTGERR
jgi:hypothetical protein